MLESIRAFLRQTPRWVEVSTFITIIVGILIGLDTYFVKADDFKKLELRLEQKIISDRADQLEQREWTLEDRYGKVESMPQEVKAEYRRIRMQKVILRSTLDKVTAKLVDSGYSSMYNKNNY
jgi:hypothetical protein